ncbi:MAG: hypothetical protein QXS21_05970 [Thermoproteota archaeon]
MYEPEELEWIFVGRKRYSPKIYVECYRKIERLWTPPVKIRWRLLFRNVETGRFTRRRPIYRQTYAIYVIPIHSVYYSSIVHLHGSKNVILKYKDEQEDKFIEWTEKHVGYSKDEWWFDGRMISYAVIEYRKIAEEDIEEIFKEINQYHFLWEKEGWTEDEKEEDTGYDKLFEE